MEFIIKCAEKWHINTLISGISEALSSFIEQRTVTFRFNMGVDTVCPLYKD